MRLGLGGYFGAAPPRVLELVNGVPFLKANHVALGYTNFDVMCIGASGGRGGGFDSTYTDVIDYQRVRAKGGGGGGGGSHRVQGLLASLPASCPVIVGAAGADEPDEAPGTDYLHNRVGGGAGGASSFNDATCRASGGAGGSPPAEGTRDEYLQLRPAASGGPGGAGGVGNALGSGGGGTGNYLAGGDGAWNGIIGGGGGGGRGGHYTQQPNGSTVGSDGGRGSYSAGDTSVFGPASPVEWDAAVGLYLIAGRGGGAKATPLNLKTTVYGSKVGGALGNGFVVIRLTQV